MARSTHNYASLEFLFAPNDGYLISTFGLPLRRRCTPLSEYQNLPKELCIEIEKPGTRILSASVYREGSWFLCVHRKGRENIFKTSNTLSSALQDSFYNITTNPKRSIQFLAFGESPGSFCMILDDDEILKLGVPLDCDSLLESYNDALSHYRVRSHGDSIKSKGVALGARGSWIIYDEDKHFWGGNALPRGLTEALELGERQKWSIKSAELSIFNPEEYFLVYQNGKAWYNVHQSFENKLRSVVLDWAWMQKLDTVTFTTIVSDEHIAYFERLKKALRSVLKAYPPLFNEGVVYYKRHELSDRYHVPKNIDEKNRGGGFSETPLNISGFIHNGSNLQVKRSQEINTGPKSLNRRQLTPKLLLDFAIAYSTLWKTLRQWFLGRSSLEESVLEEGKDRVRWTCSCGQKLYDDFDKLKPEILQKLQDRLNKYGHVDKDVEKLDHSSQAIGNMWTWITSRLIPFSRTANDSLAPNVTEGQPPEDVDVASRVEAPKAHENSPLLLCCMTTSITSEGFKLRHVVLNGIASDKELFALLRNFLYGRRNRISSLFNMRRVKSSGIVKFMLTSSNSVDVQYHSQCCHEAICICLPPRQLVEPSVNAEYRCDPLEEAPHPPIGRNFLNHHIDHPKPGMKHETWLYNQVPKRTAGMLTAPNDRRVEGWGVQMESELYHLKAKLFILVITVFGAFVIGVSGKNWGVQTVFTVLAVWVTVGLGTMSSVGGSTSQLQ